LVRALRGAARAGNCVRLAAPPDGVLAEALRRCGMAPAGTAAALAEILGPAP
jgi:hypothetical protein